MAGLALLRHRKSARKGLKFMGSVGRVVLNFIKALLAIILIASVFLICANAFGRYVLLKPIIWAEEVLGYSLVWMVYLGAIIVTAQSAHLKMDLVLSSLPPVAKAALELTGALLFAVLGGLIVYQSWFSIAEFTHVSQVAEIPMQAMHIVVPVSFILMIIAALAVALTEMGSALSGEPSGKTDKTGNDET